MTDTTDGSVRTGIIGYGLAGSVFHAPLVAATDGLALTAVSPATTLVPQPPTSDTQASLSYRPSTICCPPAGY